VLGLVSSASDAGRGLGCACDKAGVDVGCDVEQPAMKAQNAATARIFIPGMTQRSSPMFLLQTFEKWSMRLAQGDVTWPRIAQSTRDAGARP
jgi:hypothetical protein